MWQREVAQTNQPLGQTGDIIIIVSKIPKKFTLGVLWIE
jgi:hypothetical protein